MNFKTDRPFHHDAFGISGCVIIGVCCLIAALGFTGYEYEGYSLLNHMISELGMASQSPLAWVFNVGLMAGTPLIIIFIASTRATLPSRLADIARVIGIVAGIGGFFVGVFPADGIILAHGISALIFFFGGASTVAFFSIAIAVQKEVRMGKWLCIVGVVVFTCFAAFLFDAFVLKSGPSFHDVGSFETFASLRPPIFWPSAFLEWLPLIGVLAWLTFAAVDMRKRLPR
jgi:hypothetical membrane protein